VNGLSLPHVVFIDDGINRDHFKFNWLYDLKISSDLKSFEPRTNHGNSDMSHGTICAAIAQKYFPDFMCSSLKILDDASKKCEIKALVTSLEWCLHQHVDIVNISLGSIDCRDAQLLKPIANKLSMKTIIVGALSNKMVTTYPASFSSVIGVKKNDGSIDTSTGFRICNGDADGADIIALSIHELVTVHGIHFKTDDMNSYAAPFIVAKICSYLLHNQFRNTFEAKRFLFNKSGLPSKAHHLVSSMPDWIVRSVIFSTMSFDHSQLPFFVHYFNIISTFSDDKTALEQMRTIDFDTIIFIWDSSISLNDKRSYIEYLAPLKQDVVIINMSQLEADKIELNWTQNHRIWHSDEVATHWRINARPRCVSPEIPIIAIYDDSIARLLATCHFFVNKFQEFDYCPLATSNTSLGVLYGVHYNTYPEMTAFQGIIGPQEVNNADVLIYGIYLEEKLKEDMAAMNSDINLICGDVKILNSTEAVTIYMKDHIFKHYDNQVPLEFTDAAYNQAMSSVFDEIFNALL
jgi:hypothetical protein